MRALLLVLVVGCAAERAPGPPFQVEVLEHVGPGQYRIGAVELGTLVDLETMTGSAATLLGGGKMEALNLGQPASEEAVRKRYTLHQAHPVRPRYQVQGGVARAVDYETFVLFSLYRDLERCQSFYRAHGVPEPATAAMPAYYGSSVTFTIVPLLAADNAAYLSPVDGFMILPDDLEGNLVPLALNLGVLGHEYGHAVFNHLVWGGHLPPYDYSDGWPGDVQNLLAGLEEGLADVFGAALTGDPDFVGRSLAAMSGARDLSVKRVASPALLDAIAGAALYDPHELGAVIASALWSSGDPEELARAVVRAEQAWAGKVTPTFALGPFLDEVVRQLPVGAPTVCAALREGLSSFGPYPSCP